VQIENRKSKIENWAVLSLLVAKAAFGASTQPAHTNSPPTPAPLTWSSFQVIAQNNIFNPNRFPTRVSSYTRQRPAGVRVDSLTLLGVMSYEKGTYAFFDGTRSEYRKTLKPADTIAGYQVTTIAPDKVRLSAGTNHIELPVGKSARRGDRGEWVVSDRAESYGPSGSATTYNRRKYAQNDSGSEQAADESPDAAAMADMAAGAEGDTGNAGDTSGDSATGGPAAAQPAATAPQSGQGGQDNQAGQGSPPPGADPVVWRMMQRRNQENQ